MDNSRDSWGRELNGVAVQSPELLRQLQPGTFKVLICIKNYLSVMEQLDGEYPQYGLQQHKGYPTRQHYERLREFGASPIHRRSFLRRFFQDGQQK